MKSITDNCAREIESMISGSSPPSLQSPVRYGTQGNNGDKEAGLHAVEKELLQDLNKLDEQIEMQRNKGSERIRRIQRFGQLSNLNLRKELFPDHVDSKLSQKLVSMMKPDKQLNEINSIWNSHSLKSSK